MKLRTGEHVQKLDKPAAVIASVHVRLDDGRTVFLDALDPKGGLPAPAQRGVPVCYVPLLGTQEIALYPAPAKAYELVVRYYPPLETQ
jgi:hypothetical protein